MRLHLLLIINIIVYLVKLVLYSFGNVDFVTRSIENCIQSAKLVSVIRGMLIFYLSLQKLKNLAQQFWENFFKVCLNTIEKWWSILPQLRSQAIISLHLKIYIWKIKLTNFFAVLFFKYRSYIIHFEFINFVSFSAEG